MKFNPHLLTKKTLGKVLFIRLIRSLNTTVNEMPYTKEQLENLQSRRKEKRESVTNSLNHKATLKVCGSGSRGSPTNLSLISDHRTYIFNCGEGLQKLAFEHKIRMTKIEHIFITSATWKNLGGLPGMLLTIRDMGVPPIVLHAPEGTIDIVKSFKTFIAIDTVEVAQYDKDIFTDNVMTVKYVKIPVGADSNNTDNNGTKVFELDESFVSGSIHGRNAKKPCETDMHRSKRPKIEINNYRISDAMSYICKLPNRNGKLSLEKCLEKGVTPGPMLGLLKSGKDVTLPNGTVVKSIEVCEQHIPGSVFIVVECPTEDHLDSFVNHDAFVEHQPGKVSDETNIPRFIYHFTPQEIMDNPRYKEWMKKFGPTTNHVIINESNKCKGYIAAYELQHLMHMLHPEIFPLLDEEHFQNGNDTKLDHENNQSTGINLSSEKEVSEENALQVCNVNTLHTVELMPSTSVNSSTLEFNPQALINTMKSFTDFDEYFPTLKDDIQRVTNNIQDRIFPRLVMLGTGSSIPNKIRNTSCVLLRIDEEHSIIMDCGESSFGQLLKLYGESRISKILASIKAIYISHIHADHHMGLFTIIQERRKVTDEELFLIISEPLYDWISLYNTRFEHVTKNCVIMTNGYFNFKNNDHSNRLTANLLCRLNVQRVATTYVKHCPFASAISITLCNGQKIVYSGDTMPCKGIVTLGRNCDLLIHEATLDDSLEDSADQKKHSTASQAVKIGELMNAKFILLTHFSQRYSKLPLISDEIVKSKKVGIAYDFMDISLSKLTILPELYPILKIMYSESFTKILKKHATDQLAQTLMDDNSNTNDLQDDKVKVEYM